MISKDLNKGKKTNPYVIVRSESAGVFAGYLSERTALGVTLTNCRRLWFWSGAASLSQMAVSGVSKPNDCKFSVVTQKHEIMKICEILYPTIEAKKNIESVPEWKA